jgi:ABC-type sugar transport system permease subunit
VADSETPARASRLSETGMAVLFLAPSIALFAAFFFYPFEQLVLRGLYRNNAQGTNLRYVGWEQYKDVLTGDDFRDSTHRPACSRSTGSTTPTSPCSACRCRRSGRTWACRS